MENKYVGTCPYCGREMDVVKHKVVCPEGHYKASQGKFEDAWSDFQGRAGLRSDSFNGETAVRSDQLIKELFDTLKKLNEVKNPPNSLDKINFAPPQN